MTSMLNHDYKTNLVKLCHSRIHWNVVSERQHYGIILLYICQYLHGLFCHPTTYYIVNRERFAGLNIHGFSPMKFFMDSENTFTVPWLAVFII